MASLQTDTGARPGGRLELAEREFTNELDLGGGAAIYTTNIRNFLV